MRAREKREKREELFSSRREREEELLFELG
jgi:hypothetical protein